MIESDVFMKALTGWPATIMQLFNVRVNDRDCSRVIACFKKGLQYNSLRFSDSSHVLLCDPAVRLGP